MNDGELFKGRILRVKVDESSAKKTPYVGMIVQHPEGDELRCEMYLSEKTFGTTRRKLRVLGFDIDVHDLGEVVEALTGTESEFRVEADEYNGHIRFKAEVPMAAVNLDSAKIASLTEKLRAAGSGPRRAAEMRSADPAPRSAPPARMPGDGVREAGRSAREDAARMPPPPARPATPKLPDFGSPDDLDGVPFDRPIII